MNQKLENQFRAAQNSAALFVPRIRAAGFKSYGEYLASDHWRHIKALYRQSGRPQRCFGCDDATYQLHHMSYVRLGGEKLNDVLPLCRVCHMAVHDAIDPRTPYEMFLLARFFYPKLSKKQLKLRVSEFTNRNISPKKRRFKKNEQSF